VIRSFRCKETQDLFRRQRSRRFGNLGTVARRKRSRSSTAISEVNMRTANNDRLPLIHPGEMLREEFLAPLGMAADTALRLSRYSGTASKFWMNMQASYEFEVAEDQRGPAVIRGHASGSQALSAARQIVSRAPRLETARKSPHALP
jgi:antitoxin HigA-1